MPADWIEPLVERGAKAVKDTVCLGWNPGIESHAEHYERVARAVLAAVADSLPAPAVDREALAEALCWAIKGLSGPNMSAICGGGCRDVADAVLASGVVQDASRVRAAARAEVAEEWIGRLAALCDDDWLRRRDRCMKLPGTHNRHERNAASAWEHAAHMIRSLLNEHGYEDQWATRHASYKAWMTGGRDEGEAARTAAEQEA